MAAVEGQRAGGGTRKLTWILMVVGLIIFALMAYTALKRSAVPVRAYFVPAATVTDPTIQAGAEAVPPLASCHNLVMGSDSYPQGAAAPDDGSDDAHGVCTAHRRHLMLVELGLCAALLLVIFGLYRSLAPSAVPGPLPSHSVPNAD